MVGKAQELESESIAEQPLPKFVDREIEKALHTGEVDTHLVVPIAIVTAIATVTSQYEEQLDNLSSTARKDFIAYLEQELKVHLVPGCGSCRSDYKGDIFKRWGHIGSKITP